MDSGKFNGFRLVRPDVLDPALLRSGRLDRKIELPQPNEDARALEGWKRETRNVAETHAETLQILYDSKRTVRNVRFGIRSVRFEPPKAWTFATVKQSDENVFIALARKAGRKVYEGSWKQNMIDGNGRFHWPDGRSYVGASAFNAQGGGSVKIKLKIKSNIYENNN